MPRPRLPIGAFTTACALAGCLLVAAGAPAPGPQRIDAPLPEPASLGTPPPAQAAVPPDPTDNFRTSDRCIACHKGVSATDGTDVSIGFDWRASMMANSARDPYFQAAVRREVMDYPEAAADIEGECSRCHMPMAAVAAMQEGQSAAVFANLPIGEADGPPGRPRGRRRLLLAVPPDPA